MLRELSEFRGFRGFRAEFGKCGWWIDIGVEPLVVALKEAMGLSDEERAEMGRRGRKLVEAKYTCRAVAEKMVRAYARVVSG